MSEIVIVLGAGASKESGAPLMGDFLDVAERLLRDGRTGQDKDDFEVMFRAIDQLGRVHAKAYIDLQNIESAFASFEMAKLVGRLGDLSSDEVERLPHAMQRVIQRTIQETVALERQQNRVQPPPCYSRLLEVLSKEGLLGPNRTRVSVITFNYDLCLDYACFFHGVPLSYGLDAGASSAALRFLKLHGSLNWGYCRGCGQLVAWALQEYFTRYNWDFWIDDGPAQPCRLDIGEKLGEYAHCKGAHVEGPCIVPPTWNKAEHHARLQVVWTAAAAELRDCEQVYVFGYSLPLSDYFFRYLFALGSVGPSRLKRFCVFDPDASVFDRFRELLGRDVQGRFVPTVATFSRSLPEFSKLLKA